MNAKLTIAIDGPAGSGKSTTAKRVADTCAYVYVDTGAMYRCITLAVMQQQCDPADKAAVAEIARTSVIQFDNSKEGPQTVILNGNVVTTEIRSREVTNLVSTIAAQPDVRKVLVAQQREMGKDGAVVMDGRDIGTNVFPHADVKVFLVANPRTRAERRAEELRAKGQEVDVDEIEAQIKQRDAIDSTRESSPLTKAQDAVEIDTSNISIEEQVQRVLELIHTAAESHGRSN